MRTANDMFNATFRKFRQVSDVIVRPIMNKATHGGRNIDQLHSLSSMLY